MNDYLALALGILCAGVGGEVFIRGTIGLARWLRVSPGIIGVTVAAFATSSPELSVAITASSAGTPQLALGDALGSNVLNVALILGLALLLGGLRSTREEIKHNYAVAVIVPVAIGLMSIDGRLSRGDGIVLLLLFLVWAIAVSIEARKQRDATEEVLGERRHRLSVVYCIIGMGLLIAAGRLIVSGAGGIALSLGMDKFVVGAVIVAVGTSMPELATTVISKMRGHDEVGLNTILGSNIFNGLFIVAIAALISPITIEPRPVSTAVAFGIVTVAMTLPSRSGRIERWRGIALLALYIAFVALTIA